MPAQIRYAETSDRVHIAYAVIGSGRPLVVASTIWGTLHMAQAGVRTGGYWSLDEWSALGRSVVIYDARGTGASDHDLTDYSLQARVRDLDAVIAAVGFKRFPLFGFGHGAATAVAFSVEHPDMVDQLLLGNPFASGAEYYGTNPALRALKATESMATDEWEYLTRSLAFGVLGFNDRKSSNLLAKSFQTAMRPVDLFKFRAAAESTDLHTVLRNVGVPTIVIRDDAAVAGREHARDVATAISGAGFLVADCKTAVRELLGASGLGSATAPTGRGHFTTVLFTDLVNHTEMMQRLGDAKGREVLREHERITREALTAHGGTEVKTDGDSFMASFASVSGAVECAVALQRAFAQYRESNDEPIVVRIGLNAGEPIEEDGDFFGSAVILGARIKDQAGGGEILAPEAVRHMLSGKGFVFADRGEFALKGFEDTVRLYEVRWRE